VNKELLKNVKHGAEIYDSAGMTLEEVLDVMVKGEQAGKKIARVHTGDPSIFGAIREQVDELEKQITEAKDHLKNLIDEKESLAQDDTDTYSYFHDLIGGDELQKLDEIYFGKEGAKVQR
jgi:ribosome-associated translation inhibitor RaiA